MSYLWIIITGGFFAFFAAMGIGANDVANSFATSVGSKTLTMKQAVVLAVIFESLGAILMGSHVSETIRKNIADYQCFEDNPGIFMYGCMYVLLCVGIWLFIASYFEMPVSTTHSCVGGMIGMTMALGGSDCVIWYADKDTFPYVGGVSGIILSWFLAPLFAGIIATSLYYIIRATILRYNFESNRINYLYPILIGFTLVLNIFFIIYKGAKGLGLDKTSFGTACAWAFGGGIGITLLFIPFIPKLKKYINKKQEIPTSIELPQIAEVGIEVEIQSDRERERVIDLHSTAEQFDKRTEHGFKILQVFTAICNAFSHGANDVANSIGPFIAMYTIWEVGTIQENSVMDDNAYWILTMGGVGISLGLLVYGYKIIHAIGTKLCKITPSRGVAIELSTSLVILTGSRLKIPLSTTHCQVGATVGVGFLEKSTSGVNFRILLKTILGWGLTLLAVGGTSALLVSQGVYGPSV
jgi:solute carrier family 20 (sodium-dependent phosphate transporter)